MALRVTNDNVGMSIHFGDNVEVDCLVVGCNMSFHGDSRNDATRAWSEHVSEDHREIWDADNGPPCDGAISRACLGADTCLTNFRCPAFRQADAGTIAASKYFPAPAVQFNISIGNHHSVMTGKAKVTKYGDLQVYLTDTAGPLLLELIRACKIENMTLAFDIKPARSWIEASAEARALMEKKEEPE